MKTEKPLHIFRIVLIALAAPIVVWSARAQTDAAVGDNTAGETKAEANAQEADLVKKSLNPVADLVSLPIQNNWDFGIGPTKAMRYTANVQPVIPITLNSEWNLISRTIVPTLYHEALINNAPLAASQPDAIALRSRRYQREFVPVFEGAGRRVDSGRRPGVFVSGRDRLLPGQRQVGSGSDGGPLAAAERLDLWRSRQSCLVQCWLGPDWGLRFSVTLLFPKNG